MHGHYYLLTCWIRVYNRGASSLVETMTTTPRVYLLKGSDVVRKAWRLSPQKAYHEIRKRLRRKSEPRWHLISNGPLSGVEIIVDPAVCPDWSDISDGLYDAFMYRQLHSKMTLEGITIWDVGAHMGYHTLGFANLVDVKGHVVAFEPNPANAQRLRQNLERNPSLASRVTLQETALAGSATEREFFFCNNADDPRSFGGHLAETLTPLGEDSYRGFSKARIVTATADTLLTDKALPSPDLMKVDVEGAETEVLEGARTILEQARPFLMIEVHSVDAMYGVNKILQELHYNIEVLEDAPKTPSRAFVFAQPLESYPANEAGNLRNNT